jgi:TRAP-type mannitol/chloroaromatic compound transport system permease small subunit
MSYQDLNNSLAKTLLKISSKLESRLEAIGKIGAWLTLPLIAIIIFDIIIAIKGSVNHAPIFPIASNLLSNLELIFNNVLAKLLFRS